MAKKILSFAILINVLIANSTINAQLFIEHEAIKVKFTTGIITPQVANTLWVQVQKKYGDKPLSIEINGWRAITYSSLNDYKQALILLKTGLNKAAEIKNDSLQFKFLSDIGAISYQFENNIDLAIEYYEKAKSLFETKPSLAYKIPYYTFAFYVNYGNIKNDLGDYKYAKNLFSIAKKIANPPSMDNFKPHLYDNIANNYLKLSQPDSAKKNLIYALKYPSHFDDIAKRYLKLAEIEVSTKNWDLMDKYLKLALNNFNKRNKGLVLPDFEINISNLKGDYYNGIQNYSLAYKQYGQSILIGNKYNNSKNISKYIIKTYLSLSVGLFATSKNKEALQYIQKAIQQNSTNFKSGNIAENPKLESLKYKNDALEIFKEKIIALLGIYKKEGKKEYLDYALATAERVHQLINYQRNSFQLEGSKLFLSEQAHAIYGLAIEAAFEKYQLTKDVKFINLAYTYSESNKSVVLFESVKAQKVNTFAGVPKALLDQEIAAFKNIAIFENQLYKDFKNEDQWRKKMIDVTDELAKLKELFKSKYPQYYQYKYNNEPITIAETKSKLGVNQSVIEYFMNENTLYSFLITKESTKFIKQNLSTNFKEQIVNFRNKIINKAIDLDYQKLSFEIYKTLFPINLNQILVNEKIENLKIVADGELNAIPFESLLTRLPSSLKQANIYLLEKFIIGYLPSATMNWKNVAAPENIWFPAKYIGFGPSYLKGNDLPFNRNNVINLANEFSGESFLYANATKENFDKITKENSNILHLSMHGGASATDAMESYLAFEKDSLFGHEIYAKSIPTELAILDACETGVGILNNGEGVLNLARAFLHAGSKAVAMSLWKLTSSTETAEIVSDFTKLVNEGEAKDKALRIAKLDYLSEHRTDLVFSHPYYWSPLIIVGNAEPLAPNYFKYWLVLISLLIAYAVSSKRKG